MRKNINGNALFLILIAVALFAALSYAVTNSGRGGGGIDREQAQIAAAEVVQYGQLFNTAVQRLKVSNGCRNEQISFEGSDVIIRGDGSDYNVVNPNAPMDESCHIFSANGGSVPGQFLPENASLPFETVSPAWLHSRAILPTIQRVSGLGVEGDSELILWMGRLEKDVCIEINNRLGIENPGGNPPPDDWSGADSAIFKGTYSLSGIIGDEAAGLVGKTAFCAQSIAAGEAGYSYLNVLIAR